MADLRSIIQKAGGPVKVAAALGITSSAVSQWKRVPPERVLAMEAATGVPRYELRPDMYPPPPSSEAA